MTLTLTVWQKETGKRPSRAVESQLEDPSEADFDTIVSRLLSSVSPAATPFQIVARVGNSSRGLQLGQGWSDNRIKTELWDGYLGILGTNG